MRRSKTNTVQARLDDYDYEFLFHFLNDNKMQFKGWLKIVIDHWRENVKDREDARIHQIPL